LAEILFQEDPKAAQEYLDRAARIDPDYYRLHYIQALVHEKLNREQLTLDSLNRTLELKSSQTEPRQKRAQILQRRIDSPESLRQAIEDYQILQQALPQRSPLWSYFIGTCYFHLKEYQRAQKVLEPLVGIAGGPETAYLLGLCKEELGDYEGAMEYLSRIRNNPRAMQSMAQISLRQAQSKQGEERVKHLAQYLDLMRGLLNFPAIQDEPSNFLNAGKAALELGRTNMAVNFLRRYAQKAPEDESAKPFLLHALVLTQDPGEKDEVEKLYREFLSTHDATETLPFRFDYATYLIAVDELDLVWDELTALEILAPSDHRPAFQKARVAFRRGRYDECRSAALRAIQLAPSLRDEVSILIGHSFLRSGDEEKATRAFTDAIDSTSTDLVALRNFDIGYIYRDEERWPECIRHWEQSLELSPSNQTLRFELGRAYLQSGSFEIATECFTEVSGNAEMDDLKSRAETLLAYLAGVKGATLEAEGHYEKAIELAPSNYFAHMGLGRLYVDQERYAEAKDCFEKAISQRPEDATLQLQLSLTCDKMDDVECSERAARRAIELEPDSAEGYNTLGYLFAERGINLEEAVELIRKAMEIQPNDPNITDSLGWAYYKMGDFEKAVEALETAVSLIDDTSRVGSSVILEHLGDAYLKAGQIQKAREMWHKAAEGIPNSATAQDKLANLSSNSK
jgi:tetratricopeptide (TPR) repeat protein